MDSSKRRRVDAADSLDDLPDCLLHDIISSLGSRQAVQTSVLSRRWRHLWRDVPCAALDEREFAGEQWWHFEDFADRLFTSIPPKTQLDAFRLHLVSMDCRYATYDRWIRRALSRFPAVVDIRAVPGCLIHWQPHRYSFVDPEAPPYLSAAGLCAAGFTRRLTTLRLVGVILKAGFLEDLGMHCPALEELHVERCLMDKLTAVASPTLRSLAIVEPLRSLPCAHLRIEAPRLAFLRLETRYNGEACYCRAGEATSEPEPLASLAEASIRLTETALYWHRDLRARNKRKLEFLKCMRSFLALLTNVTKLHLAGFTTEALLEEESQDFPVLHGLKTLLLEKCDVGLKFQALTSILWNTPNLEKLGLHRCTFLARSANKSRERGRQQPSSKGSRSTTPPVFWCKNLKSIEMEDPQEDATDLVKVLSIISEGMHPGQWQRVKKSTAIVGSTAEIPHHTRKL